MTLDIKKLREVAERAAGVVGTDPDFNVDEQRWEWIEAVNPFMDEVHPEAVLELLDRLELVEERLHTVIYDAECGNYQPPWGDDHGWWTI